MTRFSRRRFIAISAVAACGPLRVNAAPVASWRGTAMGAGAQLQIAGLAGERAAPLFARIEAEIERLEDIFSLYRPTSALCRLNATGMLNAPPPELLEVLSLSAALHRATGGAFDPSVQPLWRLYADAALRGALPTDDAIGAVMTQVGFSMVDYDTQAARFVRPGMSLTFNGIAQGYAADRVAALMRSEGLTDVLVDMGEINALGQRPGGGAWRAGIMAPGQTEPLAQIGLTDRALATSAPLGTRFGETGAGHILDPRTGQTGTRWKLVSVSAGRAALADGLSTAACLLERREIAAALGVFRGTRLEYLGTGPTIQ